MCKCDLSLGEDIIMKQSIKCNTTAVRKVGHLYSRCWCDGFRRVWEHLSRTEDEEEWGRASMKEQRRSERGERTTGEKEGKPRELIRRRGKSDGEGQEEKAPSVLHHFLHSSSCKWWHSKYIYFQIYVQYTRLHHSSSIAPYICSIFFLIHLFQHHRHHTFWFFKKIKFILCLIYVTNAIQ